MSSDTYDKSQQMQIKQHIINAYAMLSKSQGKTIVPIIGMTSSGKSTLFNYLLGCQIKKVQDEAIVEGQAYAEIGQDAMSTTFNPIVVDTKKGITLCDFPGFKDNRGPIAKAITKIHSELIFRMAGTIKAVIVMIDYRSLRVSHGENFKSLGKILGDLFKSEEQLEKSIVFAFNHAENINKETIIKRIHDIIKAAELNHKQLVEKHKAKYGTSADDTQKNDAHAQEKDKHTLKILKIEQTIASFKYLVKCQDNIVVADVFDKGDSRLNILDCIQHATPISLERFNFNSKCKERNLYDQAIFSIADEAIEVLKNAYYLPDGIARDKDDLKKMIEEYLANDNKIAMLKVLMEQDEALSENDNIDTRQQLIEINENKISDLKDKVTDLEAKLDELTTEHDELNTDTPVVYSEKEIKEKRGLFNWWTNKRIRYDGIPFDGINQTKQNGAFRSENSEPSKGKYHVTYISDCFKIGHATIQILVNNKNLPDNKLSIANLSKEIKKIQDKISKRKSEIENLEKANELLESGIQDSQNTNNKKRAQIADDIAALNKANAQLMSERNFLADSITEDQLLLKEALIALNARLPIYDIFVRIARALNIESHLVEEFVERYEQWINKPDNMDEIDAAPDDFLCPVSLQIMSDPIVHGCGKSFDKASIKQHLLTDAKKCCPNCLEPHLGLEKDFTPNLALKNTIEAWRKKRSKAQSSSGIPSESMPTQNAKQSSTTTNSRENQQNDNVSLGKNSNSLFANNNLRRKKPINDEFFQRRKSWDDSAEFEILPLSKEKRKTCIALEAEAKLYGFDCQDVAGDGGCFFYALEDQLRALNRPMISQKIRELAADYIRKHPDQYKGFIPNLDKYLSDLIKQKTWADHVVIQAICNALEINITILNSDGSEPIIINPQTGTAKDVIYLGYEVGLHFQSLHANPSYIRQKSINNDSAEISKSPACSM